jgi:hypothetical protein
LSYKIADTDVSSPGSVDKKSAIRANGKAADVFLVLRSDLIQLLVPENVIKNDLTSTGHIDKFSSGAQFKITDMHIIKADELFRVDF